MTPIISIVIPCLDEAALAQSRLAELQSLREDGHEIILVDGGSGDGTADLARPFVDRVLVVERGRALQMNAGAEEARGRILWFLHLDSALPAGAARAVLRGAEAGPGWGRFDVRLSGSTSMLRLVERMMNWRSRLTGIATGDQGIFVDRELFEKLGGFAEIPLMEDIEISARLKRIARPCRIALPIITSSRRWERDGILRTIVTMWALRVAYWLGADPAWLVRAYYPAKVGERQASGGRG